MRSEELRRRRPHPLFFYIGTVKDATDGSASRAVTASHSVIMRVEKGLCPEVHFKYIAGILFVNREIPVERQKKSAMRHQDTE
jgi:hypothetical protein